MNVPTEKRPVHPLPEGPRPHSRIPAHKVNNHETLVSVANLYKIPVKQLLLHNFDTLKPDEINWYLHYRVGLISLP